MLTDDEMLTDELEFVAEMFTVGGALTIFALFIAWS
jgi:hypothetical protein